MEKLIDLFNLIFFDAKKSIGVRVGNFVMVILFALFLDFCFQFTYRSFETSKLENLERIANLKNSYKNDDDVYKMLLDKEKEILEGEHYYHFFLSSWSSLLELSKAQQPPKKTAEIQIDSPKSSITLYFLSSSIIFALVSLLCFSAPVWSNNYDYSNIRDSFTLGFVFSVICLFLTLVTSSIPIIFDNNIWVNYILSFAIQILFILIIAAMATRLRRRKKEV
ncbi:hypothetical protein [uncultured Maribacter sp.]|uniref:hypothetical protein n=1 Tax=uncultured Maribacter sp. TaxID=431308 RepID=UPI0030D97AAA|tara:strand:+ start:2675 stop:3340 length:666 start_codon:yes stop_codon:yes gene_type:complete